MEPVGTATSGASLGLYVSMAGATGSVNAINAIAQPVAVATNGTLTVIPESPLGQRPEGVVDTSA